MRPPDSAERLARLHASAAALELSLDDSVATLLLHYLDLLNRWNATYNLTAIRDPDQMLVQHVVDCLSVINPLRKRLGARTGARVLDVGSGGGLPGAIIAMLCPTLDVTCVDTVGKKAAFIQQVSTQLRLANLHARHARVEHLQAEPFQIVTSRAFASLSDFTGLTRPLLAADGAWMAMKGKRPVSELAELDPSALLFHVEQLTVPGLNAERCIVWMQPTPSL